MRIFEEGGKVNFVDAHNVLVGFSNQQDCCEDFGWVISKSKEINPMENSNDILLGDGDILKQKFGNYYFDTEFFEDIEDRKNFEEGGCVVFRLLHEKEDPIYLFLYNSHNGYYSHGFTFEKLDKDGKSVNDVFKDGYL